MATTTKSSTPRPSDTKPRLSEVARHLVIPKGIVSTGWPAVETRCSEFGDTFDEWQRGLGQLVLAKRADGTYASTIEGVVLSIPRQVAKTFIVGRIVFALCTLFPGLKVLWTAHRTRTATNTFKALQGFAKRKAVAKYVASVRVANGEQEITFTNGSVIMFGAREQGFGRGFDEVDIEVFDEAQILTERALEDMVAATNQTRHPHGALLFYMGTPPRPIDPGEAFAAKRSTALAGELVDGLYVETSAAPNVGRKGGPSLDDHDEWGVANPSFPNRTPLQSMLRLRKNLPSNDAWRREALGVWDVRGQVEPPAIDPDDWDALRGTTPPDGRVAYGMKFSPDGHYMALAVARRPDDGPVFVEVLDSGLVSVGLAQVTTWLAERARSCDAIVIDGKGYAGTLTERLIAEGVPARKITAPSWPNIVTANTALVELVRDGGLAHSGQEGLQLSVAGAAREERGRTGWGFRPNAPDVDVTPVEAVALAISGLKTSKGSGRGAQSNRASGGRVGSVM